MVLPRWFFRVATTLSIVLLSTKARAESHQVCLDFELGPQLWDASPRPHSEIPCVDDNDCNNNGDISLTAWEVCQPNLLVCMWEFSANRDHGEDKGRWEGDRPFAASRRLARVVDDATDEILWGWAPLDDFGCTDVFDDGVQPLADLRIERIRWSVTPEGTSIVGYECELNDGGVAASGPDGECESLEPQTTSSVISVGSSSSANARAICELAYDHEHNLRFCYQFGQDSYE